MTSTTTRFLAVLGLAVVTVLPSTVATQSRLPVFPGAQGFGSTTAAGRGGTIYRVTNLNDEGPGSLRDAIEARGPRTVIFDISGTIALDSSLRITSPYITIAGQTAPSPGITLRDASLQVETHDVLVQHLRVRPGDASGGNWDALWVKRGSVNVVIDHNSFSWGIDETASIYGDDITVSNNIISEGLAYVTQRGGLVGDGSRRVAYFRNLFAHNVERNPQLSGDVRIVLANNVNYNPGGPKGAIYFSNGYRVSSPTIVTAVGNVLRAGPDTPSGMDAIWMRSSAAAGSQMYVDDNIGPGLTSNPWSVVRNDAGSRIVATEPPIWTPLTVLSATDTLDHVLENAGARPADRDAVDRRVVSEVRYKRGTTIHTQAQVGAWPHLAVNRRTLRLPDHPNGDDDRDGYTNLEELLHHMARVLEGRGTSLSAPTGLRVIGS